MSPPGRKRKTDPTIPAHIDQAALPRGVYWDRSGSGRWYVFEQKNGKASRRTIAGPGAKLSELHQITERAPGAEKGSVDWLLEQFHATPKFKSLAERTRADYEKYRKAIAKLATRDGPPLGARMVARLSLPFMQRLLDAIAVKHPTKANHLLRYLRRVFAWAMPRGLCAHNPCTGAELAKERKAVRLPSVHTLAAVTTYAQTSGALKARTEGSCSPYLWIVIELAYLCRLRPVEVITLTEAAATKDGIRTNRRKGSRDNVVAWSPRLRLAWAAALELRAAAWKRKALPTPMRPEDRLLIVAEDGAPLRRSSLDSAWQRLMKSAVKANVITDTDRFGMHAMKHRGITDTPGNRHDKQQASGHRSEGMMDVYDHSVPTVDPSVSG